MTLSSYLWGLRISVLTMIIAFASVIFYVNPYEFNAIAYMFFYITLFFLVTSFTTLILTHLWYRFVGDEITSTEIRIAARQGMLLGLLACILAYLQQIRFLIWWDMIIVAIAVFLLEMQMLLRRFK